MDLDLFPEPIRRHLRRDFRQGMAEAAMKMMEELMPEPMTDERLAEIEALDEGCPCPADDPCLVGRVRLVVAEVRHLRRALRLSEASRGVPSVVGRD